MKNIPLRYIVFHIHPVSARLKFLLTPMNSVCFPESLPKLSELIEDNVDNPTVREFPKKVIDEGCKLFAIPRPQVKIVSGFRQWIDTPSAKLPVYALQATENKTFVAQEGLRWIELPDCFSLSQIDRLLMRSIYQWLLE